MIQYLSRHSFVYTRSYLFLSESLLSSLPDDDDDDNNIKGES